MLVVKCQQGSQDWLQGRCGAITASMFAECRKVVGGLDERQQQFVNLVRAGADRKEAAGLAGYKTMPRAEVIDRAIRGEKVGDHTEKAKQYAFRLAIERISGQLLDDDKFETWEMRRGRELEPEARLAHEEKAGILVEQTGLVLTDDGKFGASADGLIDDDGTAEYKCFVSPASLMPILLENNIDDCKDQVQGQLWITGREWSHFVLYCPALQRIGKHITIIETRRDDDYIEALERDLLEFDKLVTSYQERLAA